MPGCQPDALSATSPIFRKGTIPASEFAKAVDNACNCRDCCPVDDLGTGWVIRTGRRRMDECELSDSPAFAGAGRLVAAAKACGCSGPAGRNLSRRLTTTGGISSFIRASAAPPVRADAVAGRCAVMLGRRGRGAATPQLTRATPQPKPRTRLPGNQARQSGCHTVDLRQRTVTGQPVRCARRRPGVQPCRKIS